VVLNFGPCVSMWAPGGNVRIAYKAADGTPTTLSSTGGTSFASALVTGAVARLLQQYPNLTAQQVWTELQNRAALRSPQPADFDPSGVTNTRLLYIGHTE